MFEPAHAETAFTYGDILGLFSEQVRWQPLDPAAVFLEPIEDAPDTQEISAASSSAATVAD